MTQFFGTDGVRGRVGAAPMTVDFALRLASAAARVLAPEGGRVLIGKDTRVSGYMFESALEAGFVAAGVDVMLIGPLPTPGIAYMTQRLGCSFGVVISASHNRYEDNGIKFFDSMGSKLSDEVERQIERLIDGPVVTQESQRLGKALRIDRSRTQYQEFCASTIPAGMTLKGFKIVIDCANGAGYKVAPRVLADLGAEIVPIGCSPNGRNINDGCGSTAPELLQLTVPGVRAQVGLALDGDGDRVMMVDELGRCVDGDQLLFILATARRAAGELKGPVVGTVMSNLGLEHALTERGIEFRRAQVGDRYVLALLNEVGGTLGGETSGHILCLDKTTTGDGLDQRTAGARRDEEQRSGARRIERTHAQIPASAVERARGAPLRSDAGTGRARCGPYRRASIQRPGAHRPAGIRHRTRHSRDGRGGGCHSRQDGGPRHRGRGRSGGARCRGAVAETADRTAGRVLPRQACSYRATRLIFAAFP